MLKAQHVSSCFDGDRRKHLTSCRLRDVTWKWISFQSLEACYLKIYQENELFTHGKVKTVIQAFFLTYTILYAHRHGSGTP